MNSDLWQQLQQKYGDPLDRVSRTVTGWRLQQRASAEGYSVRELLLRALDDEARYTAILPLFFCGVDTLFRDPFMFRVLREAVLPQLGRRPVRWYLPAVSRPEEALAAAVFCTESCVPGSLVYAGLVSPRLELLLRNFVLTENGFREAAAAYRKIPGESGLESLFEAVPGGMRPSAALLQRLAWNRIPAEAEIVLFREQLVSAPPAVRRQLLDEAVGPLSRDGYLCCGWKDPLPQGEFEPVDARRGIWIARNGGVV